MLREGTTVIFDQAAVPASRLQPGDKVDLQLTNKADLKVGSPIIAIDPGTKAGDSAVYCEVETVDGGDRYRIRAIQRCIDWQPL